MNAVLYACFICVTGPRTGRYTRFDPVLAISSPRSGVQGLIADELVLQLTTFLRSLDLFLELMVLTPGALTANQVRRQALHR